MTESLQYLNNGASIAIYDDDDISRETTAAHVTDAGYNPEPINNPLNTINDCVDHLLKFDAVLIDHRLSGGNFGEYTGAEVVRMLYSKKKPALLVTAWAYGDIVTLQSYNRYLVNVVKKGEEDEIEQIINGFKIYVDEMNEIFIPERRPTRTVVIIASDFQASNIQDTSLNLVDAYIPSWNPNEGVTFPVNLVPEEYRSNLKTDMCFLADVNTGAESQHDLFFENFKLAPDQVPD